MVECFQCARHRQIDEIIANTVDHDGTASTVALKGSSSCELCQRRHKRRATAAHCVSSLDDKGFVPCPWPVLRRDRSSMIGMDSALFAALQYRMSRDQRAVLEDADLVSESGTLPFDYVWHPECCRYCRRCSPCPPATLDAQPQSRLNGANGNGRRCGRSSAKASLTTRSVVACLLGVRDSVEPMPELGIEVVEIAE
jgi:hypothetical protein